MFHSRKRRGSGALPSYMRYAKPRHNTADQGSLVKAISAAVVLAATFACSKGHPHCCNIGSTYRPWRREFCGCDALSVRVHTAVVVQRRSLVMRGLSVIVTLQPKFLDRFRSYVDL